jgi:hypothetical protein
MGDKLKDVFLGVGIVLVLFGAHELATMNDKHWCQVEYKNNPPFVVQCEIVSNGIARVSFK